MVSIKVKMKRGGFMMLGATGRCVHTTDGAGAPYQEVDDLQLYWPRKKQDKRTYPVKPELVADWEQAETEFWDAATQRAEDVSILARVYSQFD
jgi:hypothetical protein